jgi:hypothetical protein
MWAFASLPLFGCQCVSKRPRPKVLPGFRYLSHSHMRSWKRLGDRLPAHFDKCEKPSVGARTYTALKRVFLRFIYIDIYVLLRSFAVVKLQPFRTRSTS